MNPSISESDLKLTHNRQRHFLQPPYKSTLPYIIPYVDEILEDINNTNASTNINSANITVSNNYYNINQNYFMDRSHPLNTNSIHFDSENDALQLPHVPVDHDENKIPVAMSIVYDNNLKLKRSMPSIIDAVLKSRTFIDPSTYETNVQNLDLRQQSVLSSSDSTEIFTDDVDIKLTERLQSFQSWRKELEENILCRYDKSL
jgi:hypothetical protein